MRKPELYRVKEDAKGLKAGEIVSFAGNSQDFIGPMGFKKLKYLEVFLSNGQRAVAESNNLERIVDSTSEDRTVNNVMRHNYRVLSDDEKLQMQQIKDEGLSFYQLIESIGESRELSIAKTKIEEAVMWAVKHITR